MKDIIALVASAAALTAAGIILRPRKAYAWTSETHTDITEKAFVLIEKEKKTKLLNFYSKYAEQLKKGCVDPDKKDDIDKGAGTHYYSCATAKGKALPSKGGYYQNRLGAYAKSARTMLEDNYSCALALYKNNKPEEAMYYLGRALHFVEDMSNPAHTANMKLEDKDNNPHKAFEKHAVTLAKKYDPHGFDKRLSKSYAADSFENAANKLAETANKHASAISQLDPKAFEAAVKELVPLAAQNAMALMMRFYDDCLNDNDNFLTDERSYMLRNEATGQFITVTPKGVVLDKLDRDKEQKLSLLLSESGSFAIKTEDGSFVSKKIKALDKPSDDNTGAQFRFTALGKNRYRISAEASGFGKFLSANRSGALALSDLDPSDRAQVWIIK